MSEEYSDCGSSVSFNVESFPTGGTFTHNGREWFARSGSSIPLPLVGFKGEYRILLRSGIEQGRIGAKTPADQWRWPKYNDGSDIVGYWYEAEETLEQKTENAMKTIKRHDRTWFVTDHKKPGELPNLRSGEWEYLTTALTSFPITAEVKLRSEFISWANIYAYRSVISDEPKKTFIDKTASSGRIGTKHLGRCPRQSPVLKREISRFY